MTLVSTQPLAMGQTPAVARPLAPMGQTPGIAPGQMLGGGVAQPPGQMLGQPTPIAQILAASRNVGAPTSGVGGGVGPLGLPAGQMLPGNSGAAMGNTAAPQPAVARPVAPAPAVPITPAPVAQQPAPVVQQPAPVAAQPAPANPMMGALAGFNPQSLMALRALMGNGGGGPVAPAPGVNMPLVGAPTGFNPAGRFV